MRRVSHIAMAALIVGALLGGNCLSCPQVWMALASHHGGHSCCHHPAAKIECHSQLLSHFVKAQGAGAMPLIAAAGSAPAIGAMPALARPATALRRATGAPPPDLLSLHSLLRV